MQFKAVAAYLIHDNRIKQDVEHARYIQPLAAALTQMDVAQRRLRQARSTAARVIDNNAVTGRAGCWALPDKP